MGLNWWGPTTKVCFKDIDWILNAFLVFIVTQSQLKYTKSTIFRREALVLNSTYAWMSQVNTDLICRYTTQRHCLRASIKYQWPKSNWSRIYSWWSNSQNKKNLIWRMSKYVGTLTDNYKQGGGGAF